MKTSWNGNIFLVTGHLCGEFTGHRWIPRTKTSDADPHLNKRLGIQSWGWWFETPWRPLWRHSDVLGLLHCFGYQYEVITITWKTICPKIYAHVSLFVVFWGRFNIMIPSYQDGKFRCGDKTVFRPYYLHNWILCTDKTVSLPTPKQSCISPESVKPTWWILVIK